MLTVNIPFCHMPINTYRSHPILSYGHQCLPFISLSVISHQCLPSTPLSIICPSMLTLHISFCHMLINAYHSYPHRMPIGHMPINAYNLYPLLSYAHQCLPFVSNSLSYAHQCLPFISLSAIGPYLHRQYLLFISPSVKCLLMLTLYIPFCHNPTDAYR